MDDFQLTSPTGPPAKRRRPRRSPKPRFLPDRRDQLDALHGCPELLLPQDHLARQVYQLVAGFDLSDAESKHTSLGRRAYAPRAKLAVWVYASLIGIHHATALARAMATDAALRWLAGGYSFAERTLGRFRSGNEALFRRALEQTIGLAHQQGLLVPTELAVDSVRLRAHASTKRVRTLKRAQERLAQLASVDAEALPSAQRERHEQSLCKHREAVETCKALERSNYVEGCPSAGLMKLPDGGSAPAHRVTVVASGVSERFAVGVLIDGDGNDYGKLEPAVQELVKTLRNAGVPEGTKLQMAADAGYYCQEDLSFAADNRDWIDVLICAEAGERSATAGVATILGREHFRVEGDTAICPAGRLMQPKKPDGQRLRWTGVGCQTCELRPKCTNSKAARQFSIRPEFERGRAAMQGRMREPDAEKRYHQRLATVEPVFSSLQSMMGFRRLSSNHERTIRAEILLKLLAHNIARLISRRRVFLLFVISNEL